jgi:hypothetical protein
MMISAHAHAAEGRHWKQATMVMLALVVLLLGSFMPL